MIKLLNLMTKLLKTISFVAPVATFAILATLLATSANAQTSASQPPAQSQSQSTEDVRPATTTFYGDTGLWFVPTAEILPAGKWSVTGYRRGTNFIQGYTNVGDFAGTFGVGIRDRAEIFGSFLVDTRLDRDLRPLFTSNTTVGGIIDRYPQMKTTWSGNHVGDLYLGAKVNLLSEFRQQRMALAVRGLVKLPTGDDAAGASTGQSDFAVDLIASKELRQRLEFSAYGGYEFRGAPATLDSPGGAFRWGAGAGCPTRTPLRGVLEINGLVPSADTATLTGAQLMATDGSISPLVSATENITRATAAVTWQGRHGFFVGGGVSWNLPMESRDG